MELFLNLCWLALLLPACLFWQQCVSADRRLRTSLVVIGTLACALILLFPVISASDDMLALGPASEEAERVVRQDNDRVSASHSHAHCAVVFSDFSSPKITFEQVGLVGSSWAASAESALVLASAVRAPPPLPFVL